MRLRVLISAGLLAACAALAAPNQLMSIQLKSADLRESASPFGAVKGNLAYGDRVIVLEESGAWRNVKKAPEGTVTGWVHISALTEKHILLKSSGDTSTGASSDEVAIAGKGFNPQVESQYKNANAKLDFATIDRMEKIRIPLPDIRAFVEPVAPAKGGAK
jgi:hypothetical protein